MYKSIHQVGKSPRLELLHIKWKLRKCSTRVSSEFIGMHLTVFSSSSSCSGGFSGGAGSGGGSVVGATPKTHAVSSTHSNCVLILSNLFLYECFLVCPFPVLCGTSSWNREVEQILSQPLHGSGS